MAKISRNKDRISLTLTGAEALEQSVAFVTNTLSLGFYWEVPRHERTISRVSLKKMLADSFWARLVELGHVNGQKPEEVLIKFTEDGMKVEFKLR